MLNFRGYYVPDSELQGHSLSFVRISAISLSWNDFVSASLIVVVQRRRWEVIFLGTDKVSQSAIRGVYTRITNKETVEGLILILQSKMTSFAREQLFKFPFKVHIFHITELLSNITKHVLQPNYEILTLENKHELLEKYNLEAKQLPRLLELTLLQDVME